MRASAPRVDGVRLAGACRFRCPYSSRLGSVTAVARTAAPLTLRSSAPSEVGTRALPPPTRCWFDITPVREPLHLRGRVDNFRSREFSSATCDRTLRGRATPGSLSRGSNTFCSGSAWD